MSSIIHTSSLWTLFTSLLWKIIKLSNPTCHTDTLGIRIGCFLRAFFRFCFGIDILNISIIPLFLLFTINPIVRFCNIGNFNYCSVSKYTALSFKVIGMSFLAIACQSLINKSSREITFDTNTTIPIILIWLFHRADLLPWSAFKSFFIVEIAIWADTLLVFKISRTFTSNTNSSIPFWPTAHTLFLSSSECNGGLRITWVLLAVEYSELRASCALFEGQVEHLTFFTVDTLFLLVDIRCLWRTNSSFFWVCTC